MGWRRAAIIAALFLFGWAIPATAQDVTLSSPDGAVEITGTLLGFDGEFYRVDTRFGELTVDGSGVTCDGPGCPNLSSFVAEVTFAGSSSIAEGVLPALLDGFAVRRGLEVVRTQSQAGLAQYALVQASAGRVVGRFWVRISNADEGFEALLTDSADVVMALREIRPAERQRAFEAGLGDMTGPKRSRVLALDAMVPIVSPSNPLDRISTPQLADVFGGKVTNWSDLGGPDAPIAVHLPGSGSGLSQAVEDKLMRPAQTDLMPGILRHDRGQDLVAAVVADPFAIGMASFSDTGAARSLTLTGGCGYPLSANRRTIKTEDYPLTSPMFLYLPARRLPKLARQFLSYTTTPEAQRVIRQSGFVDQEPELIALDAQGERFANAIRSAGEEIGLPELQRLVTTLDSLSRLTTSFRFETGSARPDAQSRSNILQIARAIEAGEYDARRLLFVGFSDGEGAAASNTRIALARARSVRAAVLEAAEAIDLTRVEIEIDAFGEALPMACDDSAWGRQVNRRVEVWVQ